MDVFTPQPQLVFHNAATFDTTHDVFDANPHLGHLPVLGFGCRCQLTAARLFVRLLDLHCRDHKALKAEVLIEDTV